MNERRPVDHGKHTGLSPLEAATGGSDEALATLLERFGPTLRDWLEARFKDEWRTFVSIDDILRETYADAFLGIMQVELPHEQALSDWLRSLAKDNLFEAIKGARGLRREQVDGQDAQACLGKLIAEGEESPAETPSMSTREELDGLAAGLPEAYRETIVGYDLNGESAVGLSARLGLSVGTFAMRRTRAISMLQGLVGRQDAS